MPLLELRNFIADTQWDWTRRNFIGRTITPEGKIKVGADQYSPQMVEDLLYFTLAAQARANEMGSPSVVRAIGLRELIAIDFFWSLRAWHPPFHALAIYFDHCAGNRRYAPRIERPHRPTPVPVIGEIYVGTDWDDQVSPLFPAGLRHPIWEINVDSCGPGLKASKAGKIFLDLEEAPELDVDEEGAADFIEKPFKDQVVLDAVAAAMRRSAEALHEQQVRDEAVRLLGALSPREREVAHLVAQGQPNKVIAANLGISEKTVHIHRQHVMEKAGVSSAAELARLTLRADPAALD